MLRTCSFAVCIKRRQPACWTKLSFCKVYIIMYLFSECKFSKAWRHAKVLVLLDQLSRTFSLQTQWDTPYICTKLQLQIQGNFCLPVNGTMVPSRHSLYAAWLFAQVERSEQFSNTACVQQLTWAQETRLRRLLLHRTHTHPSVVNRHLLRVLALESLSVDNTWNAVQGKHTPFMFKLPREGVHVAGVISALQHSRV